MLIFCRERRPLRLLIMRGGIIYNPGLLKKRIEIRVEFILYSKSDTPLVSLG
jgi:hypothetical protein